MPIKEKSSTFNIASIHVKEQRKTDYNEQKQYRSHKHQQKKKITRKKWEVKQLCGYFKRLTSEISHEKTWIWLRRENLKGETESLLIAAQRYNDYVKARINKNQQNRKCKFCGDRDNLIKSECSKLTQREYKTRHDWVEKVIQ